jgi:serine/threonine-protein kinase
MKRAFAVVLLALSVAACGGGGGGGSSGGGGVVVSPPPPPPPAPPSPPSPPQPPPTGGLFLTPEPWNKDVSAFPKSSRSDAILAQLSASGGWGNGNRLQIDFSIPLLTADGSTPRRTITAPSNGYCFGGNDCDAVPIQVPIPTNGNTEGSSTYACDTANNDCHVLVYESAQKKLYELYQATSAGSNFTAYGVFVWDLQKQYTDVLRGDQCTSADAAGLPIAALLPTADEVAAGSVPHAIRFILPNARMKKSVYVRPATHAGAPGSTNANAPPYGVRFRLKASFDETPYSAGAKVILHAMKTYGMILSDGGNIALTFADDRLTAAKWSSVGVTAQSFSAIQVSDFEVVDLGAEIPLTFDCVRAP